MNMKKKKKRAGHFSAMDQQITMLEEKDVYGSLAHDESHQLIRQFVLLVDNSTFFFTLVICQKSNSLFHTKFSAFSTQPLGLIFNMS
jgi:hypothetical protein